MSPGRSVGAEHLLNIGAEPFVVDWSSMTKGAEPIWNLAIECRLTGLDRRRQQKGPRRRKLKRLRRSAHSESEARSK
jgi:hypothetical protein